MENAEEFSGIRFFLPLPQRALNGNLRWAVKKFRVNENH
jgi:hypothetical protein